MIGLTGVVLNVVAGLLTAGATLLIQHLWKKFQERRPRNADDPSRKMDPLPIDKGKKKGVKVLIITIFFLLGSAVWNFLIGPSISSIFINKEDLSLLIHSRRWITYDPLHYIPSDTTSLEVDSLSQELEWIQNAGFTGIITFTSRGVFSSIPKLAKEKGLSVIMGIWDPSTLSRRF